MNTKTPLKNRKKIAILLFFATILVYIIFVGRFSYIMVKGQVNGEDLIQNVENLYTRSSVLEAKRGTIYDIGGDPIAMDATSYSLIAILTDAWSKNSATPQYVVDKEKTAQVLSQYIAMSEADILSRLNQEGLAQVEFGMAGKGLSYDTMSNIEAESLPGIVFQSTPNRLYPNGVFASHLVGVAQLATEDEEKTTELEGIMGIEKAYDDLLAGTDGQTEYQKDSKGYILPKYKVETTEPVDGKDIYLTLDKRMQVYLESVMNEVNEKYSPESMTATLMNPKTGAIIAASQRPSFNGTTKEGIDQMWQNLLVENAYEPGSTMKVLTLASAISEGVFNPNELYQSGSVEVSGKVIRDHNNRGWGTISYLEGFARSSNVAFVNLLEKMGTEKWKEYMDAFGFGTSVGSGLLNETSGSNPYEGELQKYNTAFGQGVSVTVLQMMQAFSAIANDGEMMKPQYINKIVDPETGEESIVEPEVVGTPITEEVADQTLRYMKEVVYSESGTGQGYQIDGYELAVKTGTAQVVNPETKTYYNGGTDYLYSVVGMAPADDPEVVLYVTVQQPNLPEGSVAGSSALKDLFNPVMKRALEYQHLEDDAAERDVNEVEMPKVTSISKSEATEMLEDMELDVTVVGNGATIVQQLPLPNERTIENQRVVLLTNGAMTMPDMTGWSRDDVLKVSEITGLSFEFEGEGYVVSQSLEPMTNMQSVEKISITLETPQE